jgi:hypothetical protein
MVALKQGGSMRMVQTMKHGGFMVDQKPANIAFFRSIKSKLLSPSCKLLPPSSAG